jgi:hypothetical protein
LALGRPLSHVHDLRHTGITFAARTSASLRDLMARIGLGSADAAMIYQDATSAVDRAIADAVDTVVRDYGRDDPEDGAAGVRAVRR